MISLISICVALLILGAVVQDAFEVMVLPRRVYRRVRLTRFFYRASWAAWSRIARRAATDSDRARLLGFFGASSLMTLFALWAAALILGFGLLQWAVERGNAAHPTTLAEQLYMSGVTFFTLGYGDIVPHRPAGRFVSVLEAGCGLGFIAVVIAYLPLLHTLFSRREAHVIGLDARAGSPPTACTMLLRHAEEGGFVRLEGLLRDWEIWAADLLESHLSYPMLVYYRSQHDDQSWLSAMTAIMDCCALILVGVEEMPALQARMTFTMARQVLVEIAKSFRVTPSPYTGGDRLAHADFVRLVERLGKAGVRWTERTDAEETLRALRATYEPLLDGLNLRLMLPLPGWMARGDAADHWQGGHRGTMASRLIEQLAERAAEGGAPAPGERRISRRLRARLRRR